MVKRGISNTNERKNYFIPKITLRIISKSTILSDGIDWIYKFLNKANECQTHGRLLNIVLN